ncbi:hypothetical protein B9479_007802 [Cryptococcus floricola]|uniref:Uncharacterized protein n=1 Tax=Cryptococcus floricola TaxID=2591691 RepID=A0A5D3APM1_9TREE|nr:hypothetical protein B9479_007802 [Cryptococcus floricola]
MCHHTLSSQSPASYTNDVILLLNDLLSISNTVKVLGDLLGAQ